MAKNVNIYKPKGKDVFYFNFRVKVNDAAGGVKSMQVNRSAGTSDRRAAQSIGNAMRDRMLVDYFKAPKLREGFATIGEVERVFKEKSNARTAQAMARIFVRVVAEMCGVTVEAARRLSTGCLTREAFIEWRLQAVAAGKPAITVRSEMLSVKAMFSRRGSELYGKLRLPDLEGFRRVALPEVLADKKFRRIAEETLARMDEAAEGLWVRGEEGNDDALRNAWAAYWLMRLCGLRNNEVMALRWSWIAERDGVAFVEIRQRDGFMPKGSAGDVPVSAELLAKLRARMKREDGQECVLLGLPTMRQQGAHGKLNEFVRGFLPDRAKGAYELRKQYGSEMARTYGIETAAKLLRHASISTTWGHYFDDLKMRDVKGLSAGFGGGAVAAVKGA